MRPDVVREGGDLDLCSRIQCHRCDSLRLATAVLGLAFGVSNLPYPSHFGRSDAVSKEKAIDVRLSWAPVRMNLASEETAVDQNRAGNELASSQSRFQELASLKAILRHRVPRMSDDTGRVVNGQAPRKIAALPSSDLKKQSWPPLRFAKRKKIPFVHEPEACSQIAAAHAYEPHSPFRHVRFEPTTVARGPTWSRAPNPLWQSNTASPFNPTSASERKNTKLPY
jgi:hypothetical protein